MAKNNEYYILKTIEEIDIILGYSNGLSIDDLVEKPVVLEKFHDDLQLINMR